MPVPRCMLWMFSMGLMMLGPSVLHGQDYPNKPLRILTAEAGGSLDLVARLIAPGLSVNLGQQVIVDNRPFIIAADTVAKATPDGYTLFVGGVSFWLGPLMRAFPYDPVKDFSPVTLIATTHNVLLVHPSVAANSVKELIALAKGRPGELNYAAGGVGSVNHLSAEMFKAMAGVNIVRVNYKGGGPALNALVGGQVQLMFVNAGTALPHIKSGKLRILAVGSAKPSALVPDVPTMSASGLAGYEAASVYGLFVPAKTPAPVVRRLNQEAVRFLRTADAKDKFLAAGYEEVGSTSEQLAAHIKSEMARMGKVIKDANIRIE